MPAILATAGFVALESALHARHSIGHAPVALAGLFSWWWEAFYAAGYALYLAPLAVPPVRAAVGRVRRILLGFMLQVVAGAFLLVCLPLRVDVIPCLHVSNAFFICLVLLPLRQPLISGLSASALLVVTLSTVLTQRHDWLDALIGLALGGIAFRTAFSNSLDFLNEADPWSGIAFELRDLANLFISNRRENWERTYAAGGWEFLRSPDQRPRHYAISGVIRDRFPRGADVLDVGCGYGTLFPLISDRVTSYTGIDPAEPPIRECRETVKDGRCAFETAAFEDYHPGRAYDVVVLNEVLYYFPLRQTQEIFARALRLLRDDRSVLIISMNRNIKAAWLWRKLSRAAAPEQSLRVTNLATGSYWTVNVYRGRLEGKKSGRLSARAALCGLFSLAGFLPASASAQYVPPRLDVESVSPNKYPHVDTDDIIVADCQRIYGNLSNLDKEEMAVIRVLAYVPWLKPAEHLAQERAGDMGANCLMTQYSSGIEGASYPLQLTYRAFRLTKQSGFGSLAGRYPVPIGDMSAAAGSSRDRQAPGPSASAGDRTDSQGSKPRAPSGETAPGHEHLWTSGDFIYRYEIGMDTAKFSPKVWEDIAQDFKEYFPASDYKVLLRAYGEKGRVLVDFKKMRIKAQ